MYEIFDLLCKKNNIKPADITRDTGLTASMFSDWKRGKSSPKHDKLQIIADYFNVSLEYLMTGKEKEGGETYYLNNETREIAQEIFENKDMRTLFDMSRKMSPERLKAHIEFMRKLQESESE